MGDTQYYSRLVKNALQPQLSDLKSEKRSVQREAQDNVDQDRGAHNTFARMVKQNQKALDRSGAHTLNMTAELGRGSQEALDANQSWLRDVLGVDANAMSGSGNKVSAMNRAANAYDANLFAALSKNDNEYLNRSRNASWRGHGDYRRGVAADKRDDVKDLRNQYRSVMAQAPLLRRQFMREDEEMQMARDAFSFQQTQHADQLALEKAGLGMIGDINERDQEMGFGYWNERDVDAEGNAVGATKAEKLRAQMRGAKSSIEKVNLVNRMIQDMYGTGVMDHKAVKNMIQRQFPGLGDTLSRAGYRFDSNKKRWVTPVGAVVKDVTAALGNVFGGDWGEKKKAQKPSQDNRFDPYAGMYGV